MESGKEFSVGGARKVRPERGRPSLLAAWGPVVLVLVVLAAGFASFEYDVAERLGWAPEEPVDPAAVAPPPGLDLPEMITPGPLAPAANTSGRVSAAKIREALAAYADAPELGEHRMIAVGGLDGTVFYDSRTEPVIPASTLKIVTGAAAIESLGADTTFATTVRVGATPDEIVIVGGGDPFLMRRADPNAYPRQADLATLAARTATVLEQAGMTSVRLGFDDSLFAGPRISPDWPVNYVPDAVVSPIAALFANQGRKEDSWGFEDDPAAAAAVIFADELTKAGITVEGTPLRTVAEEPASQESDGPDSEPEGEEPVEEASIDPTAEVATELTPGRELAAVHSAPVWQIVDRVLLVSDNEAAELLAHHVAIAEGEEPTFEGAAAAVSAVLAGLGIDHDGDRILDGSGLSRENRLTAQTLLDVLALSAAQDRPELRPVITGLPVAGFTGSLARRYADSPPPGLGRVRAKTGTLTGVHGLAGITTDLDGNVFTFVFLADQVAVQDTLDARVVLEDLTAALAACHCSA